jgi:hypothetical protein
MFWAHLYVKFGLVIGCCVSFLLVLFPAVNGNGAVLLFPIATALLSLLFYFVMRRNFALSSAILAMTTQIISGSPAIVVLVVLQGFATLVISAAFGVEVFLVAALEWSPAVYLYLLFSYLWITMTLGYVVYMTAAGLGASWYFLNDTNCLPAHPVWDSFKRAVTTSFGSAALIAFIIAVIKTLRYLVEIRPSREREHRGIELLRVCALCILDVLEVIFGYVSRYALIYCATFGVPFREGCRRWAELSVNRFADLLMSGSVIGMALLYNFVVFVVGTGLLGLGIGGLVGYGLATCIGTILVMVAIFAVLVQPITAVSDTLLVCFGEAPERLRSSAAQLYDYLVEHYGNAIAEKISRGA